VEELKEQSKAEFAFLSSYYDSSLVSWFFKPFYKRIAEEVQRLPRRRILGIGCDTATLEILLTRSFPDSMIIGLDLSRSMLEQARKKSAGLTNISFIEGDAENLPFPSESFEVVRCSHSFHHYPNQKKALSEMHRVLAPKGTLLLADGLKDNFLGRCWFFLVERIFEPGVLHFSSRALHEKMAATGLSNISVKKLMFAYGIIRAHKI